MVDWFWINNSHFKFLVGFAKPKEASGKWAFLSILSGNKMGSHVEAIGTCYLTLSSGFVLELEKIFYVPSFLETWFQFQDLYLLDIPLNFQKHSSVYFINLIMLGIIFCLMIFTALIYKTMSLMIQCMFTLALKDVLLLMVSNWFASSRNPYTV